MTTAKEQKSLTLTKLRVDAGLTQRQLAQALDVTVSTVSAWETGRHEPRLTFNQMKLLAESLGCSVEDLIKTAQNQNQPRVQS